ncbi:MAG: efflux RND transporter periplasmic adaptor subunit [Stanieria sp.]
MEIPLFGKLKRPLPWIVGIITGSFILLGTTIYFTVQNAGSRSELEELTVPVEQQDLTVQIKASGTVEPIKSVNISPKNPGRLAKLLVEQGDSVKQGQKLAVMENVDVQAQGVQAQADLKQAIANLQEKKVSVAGEIEQAKARLVQAQAQFSQAQVRIPKDIDQTRAQLQAAESGLKLAQERIKRNQYLLEQGAITQDRFDETVNNYQNAQANVAEIAQRLEQLKSTSNPELEQLAAAVGEAKLALEQRQQNAKNEIASLEAAVESAQAALKQVEVQFVDTILTAPFDGIITQKYAVEGAFVTPTTSASSTASATSTSILAIAQGLEIVAEVPEVDIGQLQPGQKVRIVADAYPDDVFFGAIKTIAPEAVVEDNVTSFQVKIALMTGQDKLLSKMNVDVTFLGQELNNALVVPTVAIVTQEGEQGVMILNQKNQPEFKPVKIGLTLGDKTQILSGLSTSDRVFIDLPEEKNQESQ